MNWKKLAHNYQAQMIQDLTTLVAINSANDPKQETTEFPLGPGPAHALQQMLAFGERDGFITKNVDQLGGHIQYGTGDEILGIFGHMDTVPAGEGWNSDPFLLTNVDGQLFGRGALDDKGPSLAAYYALRILKDQNIKPSKTIRLIFGTDEENQWRGINHYLEVEPLPDLGFSPDGEFPVINGEKGIVSYQLQFPIAATTGDQVLMSFQAGLRPNMVPQSATCVVQTLDSSELVNHYNYYLKQHPQIQGNALIQDQAVTLTLVGQGCHAMEPENGYNAATFLADFLADQRFDDQAQAYLQFIQTKLHLDFTGTKLGLAYQDETMGALSQSPDIFQYDQTNSGNIVINVRYPKGHTAGELQEQYQQSLPINGNVTAAEHAQEPHYVSDSDPLVSELLKAYRTQTNDLTSQPMTVGGGTYGRLLNRGVAFGALMPDGPNVMHQANEYITIDNLLQATAIYADALWRLTKNK
ncbi:dipeptidase PepV [Bombilactobacillus folatiphilus]|uniref:Dipeptidase PepV n=1 Tax=Bombilactobacillus folatiphilus TaxID=2923362 RepID=A0ABY4P9R1_9LACO|nr:dipeptidase PepV [Bombilactobacillus folatiphilus]UQS82483.1 dipeptidase PepV [Bombilactobacillus folatiphilus]